MTNVEFFRAFAADIVDKSTAYYFEHGTEALDFHNLYDADSATDSERKMFHYTTNVTPVVNESGGVDGVRYRGGVYLVLKSQSDEVVDVQLNTAYTDGKYEKYVKDMIDGGGVFEEIMTYNNCNTSGVATITFSGIREVYNFMDFNGDGIFFNYELYIRN